MRTSTTSNHCLAGSSLPATLSILLLLTIPLHVAAAPPSAPAPATRPASRSPGQQQDRLVRLTHQAIQFSKAGKLEEAEAALREALAIRPISLNLYNMACIKARKGQLDAAMDYLQRSAEAGYTDFAFIEKDPDLDPLRGLPQYTRFIARKDDYQRKAAERELAWLKRELGDGYLYEVDSTSKLIFATNTDPQTLAALKKRLLMQARSQWQDLFSHRPDRYISIVLPNQKDYRRLVVQPNAAGVYNHQQRILVAQHLGQVINHEFTHALHDCDIDPLGQQHATWISEGLATMFEAGRFEGERLIPGDSVRLAQLQQACRRNRLIPLERLFRMDAKAFIDDATRAYGQSGSLLLYLYEHNLLKSFYEAYKATYDRDKTGRLALEQATGLQLLDLESQWKIWMMQRTPPPLNTGERGPILGVRFAQANDGLRVDYVLRSGPAARAGILSGDIVVAIDGDEVRDEATLMPLLAQRRVGQTVTLRIRRQGQYCDITVTLAARD